MQAVLYIYSGSEILVEMNVLVRVCGICALFSSDFYMTVTLFSTFHVVDELCKEKKVQNILHCAVFETVMFKFVYFYTQVFIDVWTSRFVMFSRRTYFVISVNWYDLLHGVHSFCIAVMKSSDVNMYLKLSLRYVQHAGIQYLSMNSWYNDSFWE